MIIALIKSGIYITTDRIENASKGEILLINDEMAKVLDEIDWHTNTKEEKRVYNLHNNIVSAMFSRFPFIDFLKNYVWYI